MKGQSLEQNKIWHGAFILTLAGLISKVLSAGYRVPYQNIAGDIGFYIYQQVYPFYGMAVILATYGFPVVISKLIAEQIELKSPEGVRKVTIVSFSFLGILCVLVSAGMYFGAEGLASIMGDPQLKLPIQVVSFSFLFIPFLSVLRGYYQGQNNMIPTALSQITEQLIRVTTILLSAYLLLSEGYSAYAAGAGAVFGSITGGFAALAVLVYFLMRKKRAPQYEKRKYISSKRIIHVLITTGLTICMSSLVLVLLQFIDSMTLYSLLVKSGVEQHSAKVMKGIFDRGQPLLQLGTVVATSISLTLVPFITSAKMRGNDKFIKEKINLSFRVSIIVGLGASLGLILIMEPTNIMLFEDDSGTRVLSVLALSILFASVTMTTSAILQGIGKPTLPATYVLVGVGIKLILNLLLIPLFATDGAAIATVVSFGVIALFNVIAIERTYKRSIIINQSSIIVLFVASLAMVTTLMVYSLLVALLPINMNRGLATFHALSGVVLGGLPFIWIILRYRVFTGQELSHIPLGTKVKWLMKVK